MERIMELGKIDESYALFSPESFVGENTNAIRREYDYDYQEGGVNHCNHRGSTAAQHARSPAAETL